MVLPVLFAAAMRSRASSVPNPLPLASGSTTRRLRAHPQAAHTRDLNGPAAFAPEASHLHAHSGAAPTSGTTTAQRAEGGHAAHHRGGTTTASVAVLVRAASTGRALGAKATTAAATASCLTVAAEDAAVPYVPAPLMVKTGITDALGKEAVVPAAHSELMVFSARFPAVFRLSVQNIEFSRTHCVCTPRQALRSSVFFREEQ